MITDERRISIENMAGEKDDMTVGSLIRSSFDENACGMIIEVSNIQEDGIWQKCKVLWARDIDERKYDKFMIDSIKMKLPSFKLPPLPELKFPDFPRLSTWNFSLNKTKIFTIKYRGKEK